MATISTPEVYRTLPDKAPVQLTPVSNLTVVKASMIKDLVVLKRYKANLIGQVIRTLLFILVFWFFSTALEFKDFRDSSKIGIFIFYLAGFSIMMYDGVALWSPYNSVTRDLYNGTLEAVYMQPSSRYAYFAGSIIAQALISSIFFIPIFVALVMVSEVTLYHALMMLAGVIVTVFTLAILGMIFSSLVILWKQTGSIVGILGTLFTFVSGGLFPVQAMPLPLQWLAYIFPYTWGFDIIRYYAFQGNWDPLFPIYIEWAILAVMASIFYLFSKKLMGSVERHAKTKGLHLI